LPSAGRRQRGRSASQPLVSRRATWTCDKTEHVYAETLYATKTWPAKRRIIIKAEATRHPGRDPKDNPRFVVTNITQAPRWVYEDFYCHRGGIENRIKEGKAYAPHGARLSDSR
jgi:hypothetical protein